MFNIVGSILLRNVVGMSLNAVHVNEGGIVLCDIAI